MSSVLRDRRQVNVRTLFETTLAEAHAGLLRALNERMNQLLAEAVAVVLGRERYARRGHVPNAVQGGECAHCHRRQSRHFFRHGGRWRTVTTFWGDLQIYWPRARCVCGHCVELNLNGWLAPYQRLGDDVDAVIQRWGGLSVSLRQMARELKHSYIGPLALRTLNTRLHQLKELTPELATTDAPPVLLVDGFYITQLRPNGEYRTDAKGRRRAVKGRFKRCLLVALGIWPDTGRQEILAWTLTEGEDLAAWLAFLSQLEAAGINVEHGLELLIHDGSGSLNSALRFLDLGVQLQRCVFHKLRNIGQAFVWPDDLEADARQRKRRSLMRDFKTIWQAKQYATALRRYLAICRKYRTSQPAAIATLRRDFRATLAYFAVAQAHPAWPHTLLRTTSRLERFNRRLRKHCRAAGAYHSDDGIVAMVAQVADEAFQPRPANERVGYTIPTI
jgi:Transposase, Mutator family